MSSYPGVSSPRRVIRRFLRAITSERSDRERTAWSAGVGVAAAILFASTAAPGVLWGDSAKLTLFALDFEMSPAPGGHPLVAVVGGLLVRWLPLEPARVLNLFSAACGAVGVAAIFRAGAELHDEPDPWPGLIAAAALAVSHLYWHAAAIAESYAPAAASLACALLFAVRFARTREKRHLLMGSVAVGLGVGFHPLVGVAGLGLLPLLWRERKSVGWRWVLGGPALAGLIGFLPYGVAAFSGGAGEGVSRLVGHLSFELRSYVGSPLQVFKEIVRYPIYLAYQFPSPAILLLSAGLIVGFRVRPLLTGTIAASWFLLVGLGAVWLYQRQFLILGVATVPASLLIAEGTVFLMRKWRETSRGFVVAGSFLLTLALPPVIYGLTPPVAKSLDLDLVAARTLPGRPASYFLRPWKMGYHGSEKFARDALATAPAESVIFADFTVSRVLQYGLRMGWSSPEKTRVSEMSSSGSGPEVVEIDGFIMRSDPGGFIDAIAEALEAGRNVYLADDHPEYYFLQRLGERYELVATGPLYRIRAR